MKLAGKAAVVTGSSRGVGRNVAIAFAKEGADVLVNYTSSEAPAKNWLKRSGPWGGNPWQYVRM